jgi:hypothetical protein
VIHLRALLAAISLAAGFAGCSMTTTVEGWPVSCIATGIEACQSVASLALNNMAWGRPANPTGTITVIARGACTPVPGGPMARGALTLMYQCRHLTGSASWSQRGRPSVGLVR